MSSREMPIANMVSNNISETEPHIDEIYIHTTELPVANEIANTNEIPIATILPDERSIELHPSISILIERIKNELATIRSLTQNNNNGIFSRINNLIYPLDNRFTHIEHLLDALENNINRNNNMISTFIMLLASGRNSMQ